ncbi:hypothetical protein [Roseibium sp.]|uniref:hypothetical protein n=1 Tax=Roseibium sp. TaxID=1936156 RepID=UPI003A969A5C
MHFDFSQLFACHPHIVIARLDPALHSASSRPTKGLSDPQVNGMDARIKSEHDGAGGIFRGATAMASHRRQALPLFRQATIHPHGVIAGLDPAIHAVPSRPTRGLRDPQVNGMDARIKSEQGGTRMNLGRPLS